jgi:1-acyl-sn-glycerol-3-phosphate acyltransferase
MFFEKNKSLTGRLIRFLIFFPVRSLVRLIWIKKINGLENLPKNQPLIIAANHQSYFDFISLISVLPFKVVFLAAEKFWSSNFWRPIVEATGQIKVERDSKDKEKAMRLATGVLEKGGVLGIFPQGTRSRSGEIEKTYTGVAKIALASRAMVVPVGIRGAYRVFSPCMKRPKFKKIIEIHIGKPMDFTSFSKQEKNPDLYRKLTNKIMTEIAELSNKKYKEE